MDSSEPSSPNNWKNVDAVVPDKCVGFGERECIGSGDKVLGFAHAGLDCFVHAVTLGVKVMSGDEAEKYAVATNRHR